MSATPGFMRWVFYVAAFCSAACDLFAPIYMKYDTIKGEVTAVGYEDWIEVGSIQWGVGRAIGSPVGTQREASAPSISEIVISKMQDVSSAHFFAEATVGKSKPVEIHMLSDQGGRLQPYLKMTLDKTLISSYSQSSGGDRPTESLSLNFTKVTLVYTSYDAQGNQTGTKTVSYDLATGVGTGP